MHFEPDHIYHVYNRGNNKVRIFFNDENYLFFLRKIRNEWLNYCKILCYCLMPNHFHFMLQPNQPGCLNISLGGRETHMQELSKSIGKTLSSYTQAINIQNKTTGTLFQKKTKAKCFTDIITANSELHITDYLLSCFSYIHLNPVKANLVSKPEDWPYSSYSDYIGKRNGSLCNIRETIERLKLQPEIIRLQQDFNFDRNVLTNIW